MRSSKWIPKSRFLFACREGLAGRRIGQSRTNPAGAKVHPGNAHGVGHCGHGRNAGDWQDRNRFSLLEIPLQLQESRPQGHWT